MPEWSIRFDHDGHLEDADLLHQQEQQANKDRRAAERQAEHEQLQQQRLDAALVIIRDNGCSISRSELTKKLGEQMKLSRPTVSKFITQMVKDGKLYEADKVITATPETALAF
jgi:DNA-binding MarR family transcriptional regulator